MMSERTDTRPLNASTLALAAGLVGLPGGPRFEGDGGTAAGGGDAGGPPGTGGQAASGTIDPGAGGAGGAAEGGTTPPDPGTAPSGETGFTRPEGGYGNFFDELPDELLAKVDPSYLDSAHLKSTPDTATLFKRFIDAQTAMSKKGLIRPDKDAPSEKWEAYYRELGKPEKPDAYGLDVARLKAALPESMRESIGETFDAGALLGEGGLDELRQTIHSANLTKEQGETLMADYLARMVQSRAGIEAQIAEADAAGRKAMKDLWGDQVDAKLRTLTEFIEGQEGGDAVMAELKATGMGASVKLLKLLDDLVSRPGVLPEGSLAMVGPGGHRKSRADLESEYNRMQTDPETVNILTNRSHPKHKELNQQFSRLADEIGRLEDADKQTQPSR